jgi:hypothetical protein
MKKPYLLIILFLTIISCSSIKKNNNVSPELSQKELRKLGIVSLTKHYKSRYPKLIPYLFSNNKNTFIETQGDFYNVRLANKDNLNILCNYHEKLEKKNIIRCMIRKSNTSKIDFENSIITVTSTRNGIIELDKKMNETGSYLTHPALLFLKTIPVKKSRDIINKIKKDTIIIKINNQKFEFISPELE